MSDAKKSRKTDSSWWEDGGYTTNATKKLTDLMGGKTFDSPKPVELIERMLDLFTNDDKEALVIDFFSGSGTTAEAVMRENAKDSGNRKYILVQLPERCSKKDDAYKNGYSTISEIAEERIRRAGNKIVEESPLLANTLDTGFKVFELSKSNIKKWNSTPDNLKSQLELLKNNFEEDSRPIDVVYEIMLKQGLDLTYPIKEIKVKTFYIYDIACGAMFVILGDKITSEVASHIIKQVIIEKTKNSVVVLQDEKFVNDSEKLNTIEKLNANGIQYDDIFSI